MTACNTEELPCCSLNEAPVKALGAGAALHAFQLTKSCIQTVGMEAAKRGWQAEAIMLLSLAGRSNSDLLSRPLQQANGLVIDVWLWQCLGALLHCQHEG